MSIFSIGDKVVLTAAMKRAAIEPEKYESGTVEYVWSLGVVDVKWNGIDHPISMRNDEVEKEVQA